MLQFSIQQLQEQIKNLEAEIQLIQSKIQNEVDNYEKDKLLLEESLKETLQLQEKSQLFLPFDPNLEVNLTQQEIKSILHND